MQGPDVAVAALCSRMKCSLFAGSHIRVVLQHSSHVFIVSLKPALFLRGRLFPSLNRGLQGKVKTETVAPQRDDVAGCTKDARKPAAERCGVCDLLSCSVARPHTHQSPARSQPQGGPVLSVTTCVPPSGINGLAQQLTRTILGTKRIKRRSKAL